MRISSTEPSSVILSQTVKFKKLKSDNQKLPKQAEAKRDGVITPQNNNFKQFYTENFDALKRYESTEELGYMCPRRVSGPPAVTLTK